MIKVNVENSTGNFALYGFTDIYKMLKYYVDVLQNKEEWDRTISPFLPLECFIKFPGKKRCHIIKNGIAGRDAIVYLDNLKRLNPEKTKLKNAKMDFKITVKELKRELYINIKEK